MAIDLAYAAAREFANYIAEGRYMDLIKSCSHSRLTHDDVENVLLEYGRNFTQVPDDYEKYIDAIPVRVTSPPSWSVRAPLWTLEEGRSDLTIEITVSDNPEMKIIDLDDIRVM